MLKKIDIFGAPVPNFNLRGKSHVKTYAGGMVSIVITFVVLIFGLTQLKKLILRQSPQINKYLSEDEFDSKDVFDTREEPGFMLAFGVKAPSSS